MKELFNYSLLHHNTFGMNVKAMCFVEYGSVEDLQDYLKSHVDEMGKWLHIGQGSNLLFTGDFDGVVLHSAIKGISVVREDEDSLDVRVGAGVVWDDFVAHTVECQWYGAENLSLIPGEVGASAVQNIGAYGVEAKDLIIGVDTVEVSTGHVRSFSAEECGYGYRQSVFKSELKGKYIVTYVTYRLKKHPDWILDYGNIRSELEKEGCPLTIGNLRNAIIRIRREKLPDPGVTGNAGSFFMNPVVPCSVYDRLKKSFPDIPHYSVGNGLVKIPAGWMIERCGWKGRNLGHAGVHPHQALVLVNLGGATASEVIGLAEAIVKSVREKFGIEIHPEVNYIS